MNTNQKFEALFNKITVELPYNPAWQNGTGYFDNACREKIDAPAKFTDQYGRKAIMIPSIPTETGRGRGVNCAVIFQRFTTKDTVIVDNGWPIDGPLDSMQLSFVEEVISTGKISIPNMASFIVQELKKDITNQENWKRAQSIIEKFVRQGFVVCTIPLNNLLAK